ncbi:PilW family protein [Hydrogenophaga sp.]|uniref:PilW family protein n=1 Tax=Hydrogenophaga sp. TaxID=1904254 RepID=UPI0025C17196|nr:PilW family protein [Hydrogenophaga sp.]MBT9464962.1 PilW family protein [Hydrogenophaga sp.]
MTSSASPAPQMMRLRKQTGYTLIELMIAMVLGLVIIGGVISVFVSNQQSFRTNENLGRLQENARISFELMAREIRQAGGNPCGAQQVANVLNDKATQWSSSLEAGTVRGFDETQAATGIVATGTAATERVAGTDAILVFSSDEQDGPVITNHNPTAASLEMATVNHGLAEGMIVMVCDPDSAAVLQITNSSPGTNTTIVHNTGVSSPAPGNCSKGLGFPTVCTSLGTGKTFKEGGFVTPLNVGVWYVGNNGRGGRSLFRVRRISPPPSSGPLDAFDEIAEGVVDMQIDYLFRNKATSNLDTTWSVATAATDWSTAAANEVIAVRMRLVLETVNVLGTNQQPVSRELIHVVNLRNRSS